ncbi:TIR domain-containing protein [Methanosarcina mazei]|jgi:predicted nucleotide-binding protein|uniref:Putative nucleotide-binding protein n=1 Tax=Methanosarcina mazei LYC TaxID=1434114 RepID=A0A0E3LVW0_METMZ|nr:nucleotide-binding protein [Methanosarcina mazei]AKB67706.1 putative nucleotide-binding protein [Methanosarcina mazei LYC]
MYYHVIIKVNSGAITDGEKQLNLSEEILRNRFLEPYERGASLIIDGSIIKVENIVKIKILKTSSPKDKHQIPNIDMIGYFGYNGEIEDVTDYFIQWGPGYKKEGSSERIIKPIIKSNQVFVVHGHDNEMKETVARVLKNIGLEPIILHEQGNLGKTIIEKFESCSENVSFAVVLLSPDDLGYKKDKTPETAMLRARQNVILELGYFMGKLGRKKVVALNKGGTDLEVPSDILGIVYIPFDPYNGWKLALAKEIKAAGYDIDFGKL